MIGIVISKFNNEDHYSTLTIMHITSFAPPRYGISKWYPSGYTGSLDCPVQCWLCKRTYVRKP